MNISRYSRDELYYLERFFFDQIRYIQYTIIENIPHPYDEEFDDICITYNVKLEEFIKCLCLATSYLPISSPNFLEHFELKINTVNDLYNMFLRANSSLDDKMDDSVGVLIIYLNVLIRMHHFICKEMIERKLPIPNNGGYLDNVLSRFVLNPQHDVTDVYNFALLFTTWITTESKPYYVDQILSTPLTERERKELEDIKMKFEKGDIENLFSRIAPPTITVTSLPYYRTIIDHGNGYKEERYKLR